MGAEIKVYVVAYPGRTNLVMRYKDPHTGKHVAKTAGTAKKKDAERTAAKWEEDLRTGRYQTGSKLTWEAFVERYENEALPSLAPATGHVVDIVFSSVKKILRPRWLRDLTADRLSYYQSQLRAGGRSEATIRTYLAHLRGALSWAKRRKMIREVPEIDRPPRAKDSRVMKGRPITAEEFERMVDKVPAVMIPAAACTYQRLLTGLWWSGLRLGEALDLWWDRPDRMCVELGGRRPMLRIHAAQEKGNTDRLLPIAPEFAEFLLLTPKAERRGLVFPMVGLKGQRAIFDPETVGRNISRVGKSAGVKVNTYVRPGRREGEPKKVTVVKFASAHDLRRSFGERWSTRVMPKVLQELMRHECIQTTMKYYVGRNAESTADALWAAYESVGNTLGNNARNEPSTPNRPR